MIKLYQFPPPPNFPNFSPYCVKLETYLKIAQIPYTNVFTLNLSKNPKKLMPYIELDGQIIGDSSFIIDKMIELHGDLVDNWLTPEQQALRVVFERLFENHLTQIMVYFRWVHPEGWSQFREIIFHGSPKLIKIFIGNWWVKKIGSRLRGAPAVGNFSADELLRRAKKDFDALSAYLGDKPFMFGDKISTIDGLMLAVFGGIACVPVETPLKELAVQYENLKNHSLRLLSTYYPGE
ncbi:MAG: hypothetical protein QG673_937 [Pseudomonadota bacterium]|nr:hypothetical protein [Pseudomonadota bacterium]